ncbi:hypothetical protein ACFL27_06235 [candidate division CSSED10-310 bacterium]|uniref:NnrU domain-containing protein n=1 Tax=candidate division CSSED10-310 bacterium TaxID=2855610 RepID=A0ABV6YUB6_UNCC1
MILFTKIFVFGVGMYLSLHLTAALYRSFDLWYMIGKAYRRVIGGILVWGGITLALFLLFPAHLRLAFGLGLLSFFLLYLSAHVLDGPLNRLAAKDRLKQGDL